MKIEFFILIALILAVIPVGLVAGWPIVALLPGTLGAVSIFCVVVVMEYFKKKK